MDNTGTIEFLITQEKNNILSVQCVPYNSTTMQYIHHVHVTFNSRTNRNNIIVVHTAAQMNGASSKTVKGNSYDLQSYSKLGFTS